MTVKGDIKFKRKLTCSLKNNVRKWIIFIRAVESLKIINVLSEHSFKSIIHIFDLVNLFPDIDVDRL